MNKENSGVSVTVGSSDLSDGVQTHLATQKLHTCQGSKGITLGAPQPRGKVEHSLLGSYVQVHIRQLFPFLTPGDKPYLSQVARTERQSTSCCKFQSQLPGIPRYFSPRSPAALKTTDPFTLLPHLLQALSLFTASVSMAT